MTGAGYPGPSPTSASVSCTALGQHVCPLSLVPSSASWTLTPVARGHGTWIPRKAQCPCRVSRSEGWAATRVVVTRLSHSSVTRQGTEGGTRGSQHATGGVRRETVWLRLCICPALLCSARVFANTPGPVGAGLRVMTLRTHVPTWPSPAQGSVTFSATLRTAEALMSQSAQETSGSNPGGWGGTGLPRGAGNLNPGLQIWLPCLRGSMRGS